MYGIYTDQLAAHPRESVCATLISPNRLYETWPLPNDLPGTLQLPFWASGQASCQLSKPSMDLQKQPAEMSAEGPACSPTIPYHRGSMAPAYRLRTGTPETCVVPVLVSEASEGVFS